MAAYVKFIESAGARVVPLIMGELEDVTMEKLSKLDGVLFPGGDGDYDVYGGKIISKIMEYNDNGHFYPAWGTCLGYDYMMIWASSVREDVLEPRNAHGISLPLKFVVDPATTYMFEDLGQAAYKFESEAMSYQSHSYGVDPTKFVTDAGLASMYRLTSINYEPDGQHLPFAATVEGIKYPFYATQFHPEKTFTMFIEGQGVDHSWNAISLSRHFADKFVMLAR